MHHLEAQFVYFFSFIPVSPGAFLPWLITMVIATVLYFGTKHLSIVPTPIQNVLEFFVESIDSFLMGILGDNKHNRELVPIFTTMFVYILSANMLGVIPGFKSPTGIFSNCLGMALITFFMTHYLGLKHHGIGYLKHFWGEPWWLGPLMFPIHVIGEFARPMSLSFRLFGNIFGEDVVVIVLTVAIFPLVIPIPMQCLMLFTSLIQALVFTVLSCIYIKGAMASEEH
ncbi:MAG: F0F1 ATP synthase subunit A [Candidatus Riflebacteria bacterium]|nr:F0F1 ATP synthase subunit A [Candidatus Riflebacteria bacterium]